jgi:hypothetical protein
MTSDTDTTERAATGSPSTSAVGLPMPTLPTMPTTLGTLGPLSPPPGGAAAVPTEQLTAQAISASVAIGMAPYHYGFLTSYTVDQLLAAIRQWLTQLEAMDLLSSDEVRRTEALIDARRQNKPLPPRQRTPGAAPSGTLTVAGLVQHAAGGGSMGAGTTTESAIGDFFHSLVEIGVTVLGAIEGFGVGGPIGAVVGGMTAHAWITSQEF